MSLSRGWFVFAPLSHDRTSHYSILILGQVAALGVRLVACKKPEKKRGDCIAPACTGQTGSEDLTRPLSQFLELLCCGEVR